jgi:ankyrin repeat protein
VTGVQTCALPILKQGAYVNAKAKGGRTPLFNAAMGRNIGAAEALLANGANAKAHDDYNDTPLHCATKANNMIVYFTTKNSFEVEKLLVELLLDNGADVNARDNRQHTPLFDAILLSIEKFGFFNQKASYVR